MKDLKNWTRRPSPELARTQGRFVAVAPAWFPQSAAILFDSLCGPQNNDLWTYIPIGPFEDEGAFGVGMRSAVEAGNWITHIFHGAETDEPLGMASFMRIRPEVGSVEVGCVLFSKKLQRTPAATEAMYLMMRHIFDDLGYRRYEWKCDNGNDASKRAALRLGFAFEGVFRQDLVVKGKNRDTAWFSIIDSEWPKVKTALERWLAPENFDARGVQKQRLEECRT